MSVELSLLNAVIARRDFALLVRNGLNDTSFFPHFSEAYEFIRDHVGKYGETPSVESTIRATAHLPDGRRFDETDVVESPETLCAKLHEESVKLRLRRVLEAAAKKYGEVDGYDLERFISEEVEKVRQDVAARTGVGAVNWTKNVEQRLSEYERRERGEYGNSIPLFWPEVDGAVGGFHRGDDVVIIAWTKKGKSWIADLAGLTANRAGYRVLSEKAESTKFETLSRLDTLEFGISNRGLFAGELDEDDRETYVRSLERLRSAGRPDFIVKTPEDWPMGLTIHQIEADIDIHKPDVVIVDQFSLIEFGSDDQRAIRRASKQLKLLAARKGVVMIVVAQANGDFGKRRNRKDEDDDDDIEELRPPSESDYSDTIGLIQDATHVVAFDSVQLNEGGKERGKARLVVRISRTGGAGTSVDLEWLPNDGVIRPRQPMDLF